MIWVDSHSRVDEGVTVGRINHLLFTDDLALLTSSQQRLQHALHRFSAACDRAGVKISTKKRSIMSLQKTKAVYAASERQYTAAGGEDQVPKGVFTSDGRRNEEIDTRIGKANVFCVRFIALWSQTGALKHCKAVDFLFVFCSDPYLCS